MNNRERNCMRERPKGPQVQELLLSPLSWRASLAYEWVHQPRSSPKLWHLGDFITGCHYVAKGLLNHWPLVVTIPSSPPPWRSGQEVQQGSGFWKFQWSNHMIGSSGNQPPHPTRSPGAHQESSHQYKLRYEWKRLIITHSSYLYHSGNSKGFRRLLRKELGTKTKYIFLIISSCHTQRCRF